jgi:hypothetical protein
MALQAWTKSLVLVGILVVIAAGCEGGGPTTPSPTLTPTAMPPRPNGQAFEVSGVVTDDQGMPVVGAEVTMSHWLEGRVLRPSVRTNGSGGYTIAFTSNPFVNGSDRGAARAEVVAEGYEWYWRTVVATIPPLVENFRLHRLERLTAGGSIVLSVTLDNGDCTGWLAKPCGRLRVAAPADGNLTIEAVPTEVPAGLPQIQACCVSGNEVYGNPVTLPVAAGTEVWVEVGQQRAGFSLSRSFIVKTSLDD